MCVCVCVCVRVAFLYVGRYDFTATFWVCTDLLLWQVLQRFSTAVHSYDIGSSSGVSVELVRFATRAS